MATITVTTLADSDPTGTETTLREAVAQANATGAADTIVFDSVLRDGTITLTNGSIDISTDMTIEAPGSASFAPTITVSGGGASQIFDVTGGTVGFEWLAFVDGAGSQGGAMSIDGADVNICSGSFSNNTADAGGALFVTENANVTLLDTDFVANTATGSDTGGGAIHVTRASVTIEDGLFANNMTTGADGLGGAIYADASELLTMYTDFTNNQSSYHGGAVFLDDTFSSFDVGNFTANTSTNSGLGGAIMATGASELFVFGDSQGSFTGNTAENGSGGAIFAQQQSTVDILQVTFDGNTADVPAGAPDSGGGAIRTLGINLNLESNDFTANSSNEGGAILVTGGTLTSDFNNFTNNTATSRGGAVSVLDAEFSISTGIMVNNSAGFEAGALFVGASSTGQFFDYELFQNEAEIAGGALLIDNASLDVGGLGIFENATTGMAADGGGGIYVRNSDLIGLDLNAMGGNTTTGQGDGLFNEGSGTVWFSIDSTTISTPTALTGQTFVGGSGTDDFGGGGQDDALFGGAGDDTLTGNAGMDTLEGADGADVLFGGGQDDVLMGGIGNDSLSGGNGNDRIFGGNGNDRLNGGIGNDFLGGGQGADTMFGGLGNDFYVVDNVADRVSAEVAFSLNGGIDTVRSFISYTQPTNIEILRLGGIDGVADLNGTGNDAPGTIVGNAGDNRLTGRGGNDQLNGNDGDDTLIGNTGRDTLVGGSGADTFVYSSISESRAGVEERDVINGFERGQDVIDLAAMDANLGIAGDGQFSFIGTAQFSGEGAASAGELRLQNLGGPNAVLVEGDVRGDGVVDFQILVNLTTDLSASDFAL